MPVAKKTAKATAAAERPTRARNTRMVVDEDFDEEEVDIKPVKKAKATAKASTSTAKATSAKNDKKRARVEDEESDFEEEVTSPKKKAKNTAVVEIVVETKAKKATAKKSAQKSEDDEDGGDADEPQLVIVPTNFAEPALATGELKIVSWNVAGYRAVLKKGFEEYLKNESPDIIALQESKVPSDREKLFNGYHSYFFGCKSPGLHGTALFSKVKPLKVDFHEDFDQEGRVIIAEFESFFLLNTYVPNSGQKLERLAYRIDWDKKLQAMFLMLQQTKPVIWCGDLNVAKDPIDLANPTGNKRTAGFTQQERDSFTAFLTTNSLVDTYRKRNAEEKDCYTFWTYKRNSRAKNIGWRMDYFIVSPALDAKISHSYIRKHIHGSDHCPIVIHLQA